MTDQIYALSAYQSAFQFAAGINLALTISGRLRTPYQYIIKQKRDSIVKRTVSVMDRIKLDLSRDIFSEEEKNKCAKILSKCQQEVSNISMSELQDDVTWNRCNSIDSRIQTIAVYMSFLSIILLMIVSVKASIVISDKHESVIVLIDSLMVFISMLCISPLFITFSLDFLFVQKQKLKNKKYLSPNFDREFNHGAEYAAFYFSTSHGSSQKFIEIDPSNSSKALGLIKPGTFSVYSNQKFNAGPPPMLPSDMAYENMIKKSMFRKKMAEYSRKIVLCILPILLVILLTIWTNKYIAPWVKITIP